MRTVRDQRLVDIGVIIPEPEEPAEEAAQKMTASEPEELPQTDEESEAASEGEVTA
jgi:hypothetical protein